METENNYDAGDFVGGKFIRKEDLAAGEQRFTIQGVSKVTFKGRNGESDEDVLQLELDDDRTFSLSAKVNLLMLIKAFGRKTANWIGKTIVLWVDETVMFSGRMVGGVRVRIPAPTLEEQKAADIAEIMPDSPVL